MGEIPEQDKKMAEEQDSPAVFCVGFYIAALFFFLFVINQFILFRRSLPGSFPVLW